MNNKNNSHTIVKQWSYNSNKNNWMTKYDYWMTMYDYWMTMYDYWMTMYDYWITMYDYINNKLFKQFQ